MFFIKAYLKLQFNVTKSNFINKKQGIKANFVKLIFLTKTSEKFKFIINCFFRLTGPYKTI